MDRLNARQRRYFVGQTGEHYVLYRLSAEQLIASLAPSGTPRVDILVFDPTNRVIATIQVKTRARGRDGGWCLRRKEVRHHADSHFFVFVDLEDETRGLPASYVVPSKVVVDVVEHLQSHDPEQIERAVERLFEDRSTPKSPLEMVRLLPNLRNPPPDLTTQWLRDGFRDAYWLIARPLFRYRPSHRSTPPKTEEP